MANRRLIWKITPAYLLIIGVCTAVAGWSVGEAVQHFHMSRTARQLEHKGNLVVHQVTDLVNGDGDQLQTLCEILGPSAGIRITIVGPNGLVLGDSEKDPGVMENHGNRPEIRLALDGKVGRSIRYSSTLGIQMMYLARPLRHDDQIVAVVRSAIPLTDLRHALWSVYKRIAMGGLVMSIIAVALTLFIFSRYVSKPLQDLQQGAMRFAAGRLDQVLLEPESQEIGALAQSLNTMARQLNDKIGTITQQSQEREAILSSMIEGLLAVDAQERIISTNSAAAELLHFDPAAAIGRRVVEVIRNPDLQKLITETLGSHEPSEGEVVLHVDGHDRFLQAQGTVLSDARGTGLGAVMVLHDVTRLRHLETIRRQFVANVSHELKTPITAIKAAVETILDDPSHAIQGTGQFLRIIARQADRLNAIVEDLLSLARIEQEERLGQMEPEPGRLAPVMRSAVETCQAKATEKHIDLAVEADTDLTATMIAPLLEQAIVNLLDNAIKYSPDQCKVWVKAHATESEVVVTVKDEGPGIATQHQPRLFDRFYRIDKARSRSVGGTGLGLAIVKHIALLHKGYVSLDSTVGVGSTFRMHLPVK